MTQLKSITTKHINIIRNNPACQVWQRNKCGRMSVRPYELVISIDDNILHG